ncbi:uncharacterized protein C8Q71DRAFT_850243 [Rhodofomes roseus]|uniref:Uncharacterized protein n=1 Tax=Rhodofomes roseus TaxID=34475 RepID=A0ABQ8K632_9APHY|nr:uncharacterized protein C8Q71DRAFT_850243 [Rhodofomes roseus]KAH9832524.1 hypothetical protein C8Q71DRAFT_850243 [Rhodofomes roseus]
MRSYTILAVAASVAAPALVAAAPVQQGSDALSISKVFNIGSDIANAYSSYKQNKQNKGKRDDEFFELLAREAASQDSPSKTGGEEPQAHQVGVHAAAPGPEHEGAEHGAAHSQLHTGEHAGLRASKQTHRVGKHAGQRAHRTGKHTGQRTHRYGKSGQGRRTGRKGLQAHKGMHAHTGETAAHEHAHAGLHAAHRTGAHPDAAEHSPEAHTGVRPPETQSPGATQHEARGRIEKASGVVGLVNDAANAAQNAHAAWDSFKQHHRRGKFHTAGKALGLANDAANAASSVHGAWDSFKQHHRRGKIHKAGKAIGLVNDAANAASSVGQAWQSFHGREESPYEFL